jgi:predicted amidohydrolase
MTIAPWRATCIQMKHELAARASSREAAWAIINGNIDRAIAAIGKVCAEKDPPKLIVLPEFGFQGAPQDNNGPDWIDKACCPIPGAISQRLQAVAERYGIYIGAHQFDSDPDWPGRFFNTCMLIDPRGKVLLRYRRINTALWPSPHDMMDAYLAQYGVEGTFPVVSTELGRIAMIPCGELAVPEVARVFMMRGAEIILHPTNEQAGPTQEAAKTARAGENMVYLISANIAGSIGTSADGKTMGGRSQIVDFRGRQLAYEPTADESLSVSAMIDVEALRKARRSPGLGNPLMRARFEMYRSFYTQASFYPPNSFLDRPLMEEADLSRPASVAQRNLLAAGVVAPED